MLEATKRREDELRQRQFEESDHADRLLIIEYIDLLLPRLSEIASIYFLAGTEINRDERERELFRRFQSFMNATAIDRAHPERTLGLRLSFLLFQLIAAMRAALNSRWTRPLSAAQAKFLTHYELHLEPILCSGRYPGDELLYREQIEIIADEMLVSTHQGITRPMNWSEFATRYAQGDVLHDLADLVARKLRFIFDDSNPRTTPGRRAAQARLAILALYLIHMSNEAGDTGWNRLEGVIWRVVSNWFAWQREHQQDPQWFVFTRGDVAEYLVTHPVAAPAVEPDRPALVEVPS